MGTLSTTYLSSARLKIIVKQILAYLTRKIQKNVVSFLSVGYKGGLVKVKI